MGERALAEKDYSRFNGMVSTVDPHDVSGQATLQVNGSTILAGELNVRRGLAEVTFEDE